jgi:transportin-1
MHANVCNNAIWSLGEIALKCIGNEAVLHPFANEIIQRVKPILAGDEHNWVTGIVGLAENASACLGRLAKANANFVSADLGILFRGWCEGLARITDPTERNDGFTGLVLTIYANPNAIIQEPNITIPSLVFAIVSWHIPPNEDGVLQVTSEMLNGTQYSFRPLGDDMSEIGQMLAELLHKVKGGVGENGWEDVKKRMPVNVRRLLKDVYGV